MLRMPGRRQPPLLSQARGGCACAPAWGQLLAPGPFPVRGSMKSATVGSRWRSFFKNRNSQLPFQQKSHISRGCFFEEAGPEEFPRGWVWLLFLLLREGGREVARGSGAGSSPSPSCLHPSHMPRPKLRTAGHGGGNANHSLHGGNKTRTRGKPLLPHRHGEVFCRKTLGTIPGKAVMTRRHRALGHSARDQCLSSLQRHPLLQPPPALAAPAVGCAGGLAHPWLGREEQGDGGPGSGFPVAERHVAALCHAQRAADAERRHQLHCHRPQPAAGRAETSVSCLPPSSPRQLRGFGSPWYCAKASPSPPQVPTWPHSPSVVQVEDKIGSWGGRKERCETWCHELTFALQRDRAAERGWAGPPATPGHLSSTSARPQLAPEPPACGCPQ